MKMNWYIRSMQNIFLRRLFLVITGSKINAGEGDKNMADYIKGVDLPLLPRLKSWVRNIMTMVCREIYLTYLRTMV